MTNSWLIDFAKELQVRSDLLPGSVFIYSGGTAPEGYEKFVHLNTFTLSEEGVSIPFERYGSIMHIHVDPECAKEFVISLKVSCVSTDGSAIEESSFKYKYRPDIVEGYNEAYSETDKMISGNASYQLLRANPKLTGNVKVVVGENSDLYLDTFKVTSALSQYKYRHIAVNPDEYYGRSLMTKFHKMSASDFYKVDDNCYNMFTTVNDYGAQYYSTYNCGVRNNDDRLYPENFAILAPLCVKKVLPDFFIVLKVDTDEYTRLSRTGSVRTEADKIRYFMSKGSVVKTFDMRAGTNLGKYIRGVLSAAESCPGDIFVSYEQNNYSKFIGISIDRGVVTSAYESNFDMENVDNQVAMNDYFTLGFERNRLISKDIINFEFMFNDKSEDMFSINTYFGLYIRLNGENSTFSCIGFDKDSSTYVYDTEPHSFPSGFDIDSEYPEIIYGVTTPDEFIRLKEPLQDSSVNERFMLKPYKAAVTGHLAKAELLGKGFVTLTLIESLRPGSHIRFADLRKGDIYDIVFTGFREYLDDSGVSDVAYEYLHKDGICYTVKTVSVYADHGGDDGITPEAQVDEIACAIRKFGRTDRISPFRKLGNSMSVVSDNPDMVFEYVPDFSNYDIDDIESAERYEGDGKVSVFGGVELSKIVLDIRDRSYMDSEWFFLYPAYTEGVGNRVAYACRFMEVAEDCYEFTAPDIYAADTRTVLYRRADSTYHMPDMLGIRMLTVGEELCENIVHMTHVMSYSLGQSSIMRLDDPYTGSDVFSLYEAYPLNTGVCSVLQIHDIMADVLDRNTAMSYDNRAGVSDGEFSENTAFGGPIAKTEEEIAVDYIDKYRTVPDEGEEISPETYSGFDASWITRNNYYRKLIGKGRMRSDIPLVCNYLCKWRSNGTDARGSMMRVMYEFNIEGEDGIITGNSYYVPYDSRIRPVVERESEQRYNTYLGFLQADKDAFPKYTRRSLDAIIRSDGESVGKTVRDALLYGNMRIDDIIYSEADKEQKMSRVYGSGGNSVEFISGGVKFRISSENDEAVDLNTYKNYSAVFISVAGVNPAHSVPVELIIDETAEQMALIWYHGAESVSIPDGEPGKRLNYRLFHTSPMYDSKCVTDSSSRVLLIPNDTGLDSSLCDNDGYIMLESNNFGKNEGYASTRKMALISKLPADTGRMYSKAGYILTDNPYAWIASGVEQASDQLIEANSELYNNSVNAYVFSDVEGSDKIKDLNDLREDMRNCGLFVKKMSGCKDYTYVSGLVKIDMILPIVHTRRGRKGYVHPTYAEPVTRPMLSFAFNDSSLNGIFGRNMSACNLIVTDVAVLPQIWINKYTEVTNYCMPLTESEDEYRVSMDVLHNVSVMDNCWSDIYRKYRIDETAEGKAEKYDIISGYTSGAEINTFINSRGINLNGKDGNEITITAWKNTRIMQKENCIKLDITESLINYIMFTDGYSKAWRGLNTSNIYKIRYIKKSILGRITINNMSKFELFEQPDTFSLFFRDSLPGETQVKAVSNVKNELKSENGKYYMYIYPQEKRIYYARMTIKL